MGFPDSEEMDQEVYDFVCDTLLSKMFRGIYKKAAREHGAKAKSRWSSVCALCQDCGTKSLLMQTMSLNSSHAHLKAPQSLSLYWLMDATGRVTSSYLCS